MTIRYCTDCDDNTNLDLPSDISPDGSTEVVLNTSVKKWGTGSLHHAPSTTAGEIYWDSLSSMPGQAGTISVWTWRDITGTYDSRYRFRITDVGAVANRIDLEISYSKTGNVIYVWYMYDDAGINRLPGSIVQSAGSDGWNYNVLAWDWGAGVTEAWHNTSRILNHSASYTRDGSLTDRLLISLSLGGATGLGQDQYFDDLVIRNDKKYTGPSIVLPTKMECALNSTVLRMGYPFGMGYSNRFGV